MSDILIAYATSEGQTARIASALAEELRRYDHFVEVVDVGAGDAEPDTNACDGVIVAASVHGGIHQASVREFVLRHKQAFDGKLTAFLSVSLSAISRDPALRERADQQLATFLNQVDWQPDFTEKLGGAFRYSRFSALRRWVFRWSQRFFREDLDRQGWPDLTEDREFTDWRAVERFGKRFSASLRSGDDN